MKGKKNRRIKIKTEANLAKKTELTPEYQNYQNLIEFIKKSFDITATTTYKLTYYKNEKKEIKEINNQQDYDKFNEEFKNASELKIELKLIKETKEDNKNFIDNFIKETKEDNKNFIDNCIKETKEDNKNFIHNFIKETMDNYYENIINNFLKKNIPSRDYSYKVDKKDIIFCSDKEDINSKIFKKKIILSNNGLKNWESEYSFKCLSNSEIKGNDIILENILKINENIDIEIAFEISVDNINFDKTYLAYYQMFDKNNKIFGNITEFKINFKK